MGAGRLRHIISYADKRTRENMRISTHILASLGAVVLSAGVAAADGHSASGPKIYPYKTAHNYCPTGLQPVTISGVICCGVPNTGMSYQHAMMHPTKKVRRHVRQVRAVDCPIGEKGCG